MEVGQTIGFCRLVFVGRAINPSFPISVFCTNRGLGNFARGRWGDIGGLMGIRRNEASLGAGGFRGIGGPNRGGRRRRGRLPHQRNQTQFVCNRRRSGGYRNEGGRLRRGRLPHWRNEANFGGSRRRGGSYGSGEGREIGAKRVDGGAGVSEFLFGGPGG